MSILAPQIDGACVLVVEDQEIVRAFIVGHLRDYGYAVLEASDGEEAVSFLGATRYTPIRVVFTDIQLGGLVNGWDVADAFREAHPGIAVIYPRDRFRTALGKFQEAHFFLSRICLPKLSKPSKGAQPNVCLRRYRRATSAPRVARWVSSTQFASAQSQPKRSRCPRSTGGIDDGETVAWTA